MLAVDPSSPFTGGALLGDRIRMQEHATDGHVFIRSMASRGHLGGLAASTPQAIRVLDAAGFDLILIETVGVGQAEVAIASLADSVLVLLAPGMGDAIQAAKAGILEVADLFVVNKADKPDAQQVVRDLRNMIALADRQAKATGSRPSSPPWRSRAEGIDELVSRLDAALVLAQLHRRAEERRQARAREELTALAFAALRGRLAASRLDELASRVADGTLDPFKAADELLSDQCSIAGHGIRLYPWVSRLNCRLIPSTGRRRSGNAGSAPRRRWPRSPRSCARSRSCSASSTRCCGRTG